MYCLIDYYRVHIYLDFRVRYPGDCLRNRYHSATKGHEIQIVSIVAVLTMLFALQKTKGSNDSLRGLYALHFLIWLQIVEINFRRYCNVYELPIVSIIYW